MKSTFLALIVFSLTVAGVAQKGRPVLSQTFSTMALRALRLTAEMSDKGSLAEIKARMEVARSAVGEVGDAARTKAESSVHYLLLEYQSGRVRNFAGRAELADRAYSSWKSFHTNEEIEAHGDQRQEEIAGEVATRSVAVTMQEHEEACRSGLDTMLRSGRFVTVPECHDVEVSIQADLQRR